MPRTSVVNGWKSASTHQAAFFRSPSIVTNDCCAGGFARDGVAKRTVTINVAIGKAFIRNTHTYLWDRTQQISASRPIQGGLCLCLLSPPGPSPQMPPEIPPG